MKFDVTEAMYYLYIVIKIMVLILP